MKAISTHCLRLATIFLLSVVLSGCDLGGRLPSTPSPEPSQVGKSQFTTPTAALSGRQANPSPTATAAKVETTAPTAKILLPTPTKDPQGDDLLKMINALDAANQAGDPLDNLP